jgi:hypothetical protein
MRRQFSLFLALLALLLATAALAQPAPPDYPVVNAEMSQMVTGAWQPIALEPVEWPLSPLAEPASQTCNLATTLNISANGVPDGGQTIVNNASEEAIDPPLGCVNGVPPGPRGNQGYRTVWYQFTAPDSGWVNIEAHPNADYRENYDTVIAVYRRQDPENSTCDGNLSEALSCSDDTNGFLSQVQVPVIRGESYLVEIADWQFGANRTKKLNLTATFVAADSYWQEASLMELARSRHVTIFNNQEVYLIGGQTDVDGNPERTGSAQKYNLLTDTWTILEHLPGPDGRGYSNTDGAVVGNRIYLPSGYVGDNDDYDGTHWVYDIASNDWLTDTANTLWPEPFGWTQVVAYPPLGGYYLVGGVTGPILNPATQPRDEMYFFQPGSPAGIWFSRAPMGTARYAHTAALVGGNQVCVAGGLSANQDGDAIILDSAECYSIANGTWSPINSMNYFRYNHTSTVGPDGRWYVFGGTDENGQSIPNVEVYDPFTNVWTILSGSHDLTEPPRAWAGVGFYDLTVWAFGGHHNTAAGDRVVNQVESALFPLPLQGQYDQILSLIGTYPPIAELNDTFSTAMKLTFNVQRQEQFLTNADYFDFFYFDQPETRRAQIHLASIFADQGYNLEVYDSNKLWLGNGIKVGPNDERLVLEDLPPGRYYVLVVRDFGMPTLDPYHVWVTP